MLKNKLHTALSLFLCCLAALGTHAQTVSFTLTETEITTQASQTKLAVPSGKADLLSLFATIKISSNNKPNFASTLGSAATLPLSIATLQFNSMTGISIGGSRPVVPLESAPKDLYTTVLGLLNADITVNYGMVTAGTAWIAGTYATDLLFSTNVTNNPPNKIQVTVPAFITPHTQPPIATLNVTTLAPFRGTETISATSAFDYYSSVETLLFLKAGSTFTFVPTQTYPTLPNLTNLSAVKANLTDAAIAAPINLTSTDQPYTNSALGVVATNKRAFTSSFTINAANLKSTFTQAGTYTLPVTYSIQKTGSLYAGAVATQIMSSSVKLVVAKISEFSAVTTPVIFNFNSVASYSAGLTATVTTPVTLSSTVPYSLSVKADGDFISGSNSIPAGVITIEGITGQTGITPVVLSAASQNLVLAAIPEIDRVINLQYRIPATQTNLLIGKPPGTYTANITYTLVAP